MILTKQEIAMRIGSDIIIEPYDEKNLNPNSYNLRLGDKLLTYDRKYPFGNMGRGALMPLDPKSNNPYIVRDIPQEGVVLMPGELYLAQTYEYTETKNLIPVISGRSSTGRLGLHVHITAGFGDVGFRGHWTLELAVVRPLMIYPMLPIAQIYYHVAMGMVEEYKGKYQGNKGVQPSMMWKEFPLKE